MKRIAVFPGSFDPITIGHESVVKRALPIFDEIIIAIGNNSQKKYMFELQQRKKWIETTFKGIEKIRVDIYDSLTVNYCESVGARFILRGLRNNQDFEYERSIAQMNHELNDEIETVFLFTEPKYSAISSSIVRDIYRNGGEISQFLPKNVSI